jgi:sugar/nucleoside kinase (ribokinase family)
MTLLVSGWVAIDDIETPFDNRRGVLGGSATFAALAAALFTDVRLLAAVGEDFPGAARAQLSHPRVDTRGLSVVPGQATSRWRGRYHYDMNTRDTLATEVGVNAAWAPSLPDAWQDTSTLFCAAGEPNVQMGLIGGLPRLRASMVDTIQFYIDGDEAGVRAAFAAASFVAINESEARQLSGQPGIARATSALLTGGPRRGVIVKLGEYGAAFRSVDDYFVAPGYPLEEVRDPTGAGDAFAGGFMGYLDSVEEITPAEIRRAIVYGSTVASFKVEDFGTERLLRLTRDEVDARYGEFRRLTHFEARD